MNRGGSIAGGYEIREEPFWGDFALALCLAGLGGPAIGGELVVPIHDGQLGKFKLHLEDKQGHDPDPPGVEPQLLYGDEGIMTSLRALLQKLVDSLPLAYGQLEVRFTAGQVTECRITISIRPNESYKFDQLRQATTASA